MDIGYNWENVLVGVFFVLCALFGSGDASGATVLLLILGIGVIISSRKVILTIYHSGTGYRIPVMFFEKFKVKRIEKKIREAMVFESNKTDLSRYF